MNFDTAWLKNYLDTRRGSDYPDAFTQTIMSIYHTARIADALERIATHLEDSYISVEGAEEGFKGVERIATLFETMKAESDEVSEEIKKHDTSH